MKLILPSQKYLKECFLYNTKTGKIIWRERPFYHFSNNHVAQIWNKRYKGKEAFTTHKGRYRRGAINYTSYLAHRVIWKLVTGIEPPQEIDHKDNNGSNNIWINLRLGSRSENMANSNPIRSNNTSGFKGVTKHNKGWQARIGYKNKQIYLGTFYNKKEAVKVYNKASKIYFKEFARINK